MENNNNKNKETFKNIVIALSLILAMTGVGLAIFQQKTGKNTNTKLIKKTPTENVKFQNSNQPNEAQFEELKSELKKELDKQKLAFNSKIEALKTTLDQKATTEDLNKKADITTLNKKATTEALNKKADITALNNYLKHKDFIAELLRILKLAKNTNGNEKSFIFDTTKDGFFRYIFDRFVENIQTKNDFTINENLHKTDGNKNDFFKLAPALFKSVAKANEKLNELLDGDLRYQNNKAIWQTSTGKFQLASLETLKKQKQNNQPKYKRLTKMVWEPESESGWIEEPRNQYTPPKP